MKILVVAASIALGTLTACTQHSAPEVAYYENQKLQLAAKITPGVFDGELTLAINGEQVIKQRSQAFGGTSQTFEGTWKGKQVVARTTAVTNLMSNYHLIDIFINGTHVDTLTV